MEVPASHLRFLRIVPAYWAVLTITAVIPGTSAGLRACGVDPR